MDSNEHKEQVKLFKWVKDYPDIGNSMYAIPNGSQRSKKASNQLKLEGLKNGVCDVFLSIAKQGYHGLYIEMKYGDGVLTKEQKEFIATVKKNGYKVEVCYSCEEAKTVLKKYLTIL